MRNLSITSFLLLACIAVHAEIPGNIFGKELKQVSDSKRIVISNNPARKLKVFMLMPAKVSAASVEWTQRFSFTPVLLQTESFKDFSIWYPQERKPYYNPSLEREEHAAIVAERLAELADCDLLVIAKVALAALPPEVKDSLFERVRKGAGLLYIAHDGEAIPKAELGIVEPFKPAFPAMGKLAEAKFWRGTLGKGKVIALQYAAVAKTLDWYYVEPIAPFQSDDPLYYDLYYAFASKCLLELTEAKADAEGKVAQQESEIYNRLGKKVDQTYPGENIIITKQLNAKKELLDFSLTQVIENNKKGIKQLKLEKDALKPGETSKVESFFEGEFTGKLLARLTAVDKRVLFEKEFSLRQKTSFEFSLAVPMPNSEAGELSVSIKGNMIDEKVADLFFDQTAPPKDFEMIIWLNFAPKSRLSGLFFNALKDCGVTTGMETEIMWRGEEFVHSIPRYIKKANLRPAYYTTRLVGPMKPKEKDCPLSNWRNWQANKAPISKRMQLIADAGKGMGTAFYNLGDENGLYFPNEVDTCHCPECRSAFQKYLQKTYASIEQLNNEYDADYKSWENVQSMTLEEACEQDRLPLWMDHRLFMEEQFIDYHRWAIAQVEEKDPDAACGIEGIWYPYNSYSGFRLYDMLPFFRFFAPYPNDRDIHAMHKYMPENSIKAAWYGTYGEAGVSESRMRSTPWQHLFKGLNGSAWWTAGGFYSKNGLSASNALMADFTPTIPFVNTMEEIKRIQNTGIGALLVRSERAKTTIAMHYSNHCLHASTLNPDRSSWHLSIDDFGLALNSCGLDYDFVSPQEICAGQLQQYKVLLLPYSQALSATESREIEKFVKNGGLLIADYNPGVMNEHGRILRESSLQKVFGAFTRLHINAYGKGTAISLRDYLSSFKARQERGESSGARNGFLRLLQRYAAVQPFARVSNEQDELESFALFQAPGFHYLCLSGPEDEGKAITGGAESQSETFGGSRSSFRSIRLQDKYHIYDPLDGYRYLGFTDQVDLTLQKYVGRVLVLSSEVPARISFKLEKSVLRSGDPISLRIVNPAPVMLLECESLNISRRVSGESCTQYTAFNDKPGRHTLKLTNAITGESSLATIHLK